ncbi:hypothetical protein MMC26_006277 [Xylographa opegraphella]|nr:hypothetical protein [Xylographa opegraphella]
MPQPLQTLETPSASATFDAQANEDARSTVQRASASVPDAGAASGSSAAQHAKSEVERAADKLYEERMEEEYAKREGGA